MNDTIAKYMNNLQEEFEKYSYMFLEGSGYKEKLLYLYAYYHYYNADNSNIIDIANGVVSEWNAPDMIDGIFIDEESDGRDVDVLLVQFSQSELEFPIVLKTFKETENAIFTAKNNFKETREKLKKILGDEDYQFSEQKPLKIKLITNTNPKSAAKKKAIMKAMSLLKPDHSFVSYEIVFGNELEYEILEIEDPKEYVDKAELKIDREGNYISFGVESSVIVNASAKSIKYIYGLYCYRGLFAQNLRYYVKNAKVDGNIINSIQNEANDFWYYNNGIIIICDDYKMERDRMIIRNFSIINGGQTTKLIGETEFEQDFFLQCKLIKNKYESDEKKISFIANVAEATNSQKPIRDKDLVANRIEQRMLKKQLADSRIYCQIKRGEKINKKLYPEAWQNTTNEEIGQYILSLIYQKPGTARANKASICSNAERYNLLFGKKYNSYLLRDLLYIKAFYKDWLNFLKKDDDGLDEYKDGLTRNGLLFMMAIIGSVCKLFYHQDYISNINKSILSDQKLEIMSQCDIDHGIFNHDVDSMKNNMYKLFEYCYVKFYRPGYEFMKSFKERYNNYSNFTKLNSNFKNYIMRQILFEYKDGIPEDDSLMLGEILHIASNEEIEKDTFLLNKYVNVISADVVKESLISVEKVSEITDKLNEYRTKICKKKRIKAYEVFKNIARDRIAKFAPESIEELEKMRCLDEGQVSSYGDDIIGIIRSTLDGQEKAN